MNKEERMKCKTCDGTGKTINEENPRLRDNPCPDCQPQKAEREEIRSYSFEDIENYDIYREGLYCDSIEVRQLEADHAKTKEALRVAVEERDSLIEGVKELLNDMREQYKFTGDELWDERFGDDYAHITEAIAKIKEGGK